MGTDATVMPEKTAKSAVRIGIVPPLELVTCSHVFSPQLPLNRTCKLSSPNIRHYMWMTATVRQTPLLCQNCGNCQISMITIENASRHSIDCILVLSANGRTTSVI